MVQPARACTCRADEIRPRRWRSSSSCLTVLISSLCQSSSVARRQHGRADETHHPCRMKAGRMPAHADRTPSHQANFDLHVRWRLPRCGLLHSVTRRRGNGASLVHELKAEEGSSTAGLPVAPGLGQVERRPWGRGEWCRRAWGSEVAMGRQLDTRGLFSKGK